MADKKVYIQVYNKIILGMKVYKPTFKRLPNGKIIDGVPIEVTEEEAKAIGRHCKIVDAPKKAKKDQKEKEPEEKPETKKDPGPEKDQEPEKEKDQEPEKKDKPKSKPSAPKRGGKGKK